jgi:RNA polymerase sigma-70 factor (ECF subfamily)
LKAEESDAALVQRVLGGDVEAFAGLLARHRDRGMRYAAAMLGERADAEEALQDAFVRAYRSLKQCREPERFGAWFMRILVNRCRTRLAARGRGETMFVRDQAALERAAAPADPDPGWNEEIARALAQLDPLQREAFLLKHVEELEYDEMTRLTGAGTSALKMRVMRACERLRALLSEADDARTG